MLLDILVAQLRGFFSEFSESATLLFFQFIGELYAVIAPIFGQTPVPF